MRTLFLLVALACKARPIPEAPLSSPSTRSTDPRSFGVVNPVLRAILEEHWDATMERYPTWATRMGDHRFDHLAFDSTEEAEMRWQQRQKDWIRRLRALTGLSAEDTLTRDLLLGSLERDLARAVCHFGDWSFSPRSNPMLDGHDEAQEFPLLDPSDGRDLVFRLGRMADDIHVQAERLRAGATRGLTTNRTSAMRVIEQIRTQLAAPREEQPILAPLRRIPASWPEEERARFQQDYTRSAERWLEALTSWVTTVERHVLPEARSGVEGLASLPDGAACYDALVTHYTTLDVTAEELHRTGLAEIERLHAAIASLGARTLGTADLPTLFGRLRTDPELFFRTEEEVEAKARDALARAKAAIPGWFGRLPRADCIVDRVPPYEAPYTTIAYYRQAVPGEKPGAYVVNTWAPTTRPRHEAEVLAFHESIPGHHLQIALAQEMEQLPLFRRHLGATAFVEGWALYSERLADEMGLYTTDLDRIGMLGFDLWRAARLVVDTGIHAQGWTREDAIRFMLENTPLAENNIVNEVDRYITTPGQALAYKTGQLEILALRRKAEEQLGAKFDPRRFHDVVLGAGAVSLPVLHQIVDTWIAAEADP